MCSPSAQTTTLRGRSIAANGAAFMTAVPATGLPKTTSVVGAQVQPDAASFSGLIDDCKQSHASGFDQVGEFGDGVLHGAGTVFGSDLSRGRMVRGHGSSISVSRWQAGRVDRPCPSRFLVTRYAPQAARRAGVLPGLAPLAKNLSYGLGTRGQTGGGHGREQGDRTGHHAVPRRGGGDGCGWLRGTSAELDELTEGRRVVAVQVDLATPAGPTDLVSAALEGGPLDIVVNNVGAVATRLDGFLAVTDEQWSNSLTLTFLAAVRTTRAALPGYADRRARRHRHRLLGERLPARSGRHRLLRRQGRLGQLLQGVVQRSRTARYPGEHREPGSSFDRPVVGRAGVATAVGSAQGVDPDSVVRQQEQQAATGRFTTPEEVADLVVVLASDRTGNVTGSDFVIDGGLVTTL